MRIAAWRDPVCWVAGPSRFRGCAAGGRCQTARNRPSLGLSAREGVPGPAGADRKRHAGQTRSPIGNGHRQTYWHGRSESGSAVRNSANRCCAVHAVNRVWRSRRLRVVQKDSGHRIDPASWRPRNRSTSRSVRVVEFSVICQGVCSRPTYISSGSPRCPVFFIRQAAYRVGVYPWSGSGTVALIIISIL